LTLYHGSKNGINGLIDLKHSRDNIDFGTGFYLAEKKTQPLQLISSIENRSPKLYTCSLAISNLKMLHIKNWEDWLFAIAYNRDMIPKSAKKLKNKYAELINGYDIVIGKIANDNIFNILDNMFANNLGYTVDCVKQVVPYMTLGDQVVLKTAAAISNLKIVNCEDLLEEKRKKLLADRVNERHALNNIVGEKMRKYRGENIYWNDYILKVENAL
jgi:hypothetical protein